jgi:LysM repeat protein
VSRADRARPHVARYAAPVAFLLGVTIAVLLIRSGLGGGSATTTVGPVTHPSTSSVTTTRHKPLRAHYYTVQTGDTFGAISAKTGTSIAELERLNPGVSSNTLQVGQRLRVK